MKKKVAKRIKRIEKKKAPAKRRIRKLNNKEGGATPADAEKLISELGLKKPMEEFLTNIRMAKSQWAARRIVLTEYQYLFDGHPPPGVHIELVKAAVGYELLYRSFLKHDCLHLLCDKIRERRQRALKLSLEAWVGDEDMFTMYASYMSAEQRSQAQGDDDSMATKKKAVAKKTPKSKKTVGLSLGLTIGQTWAHLFERNEKCPKKDKLTDDAISEFIKKEFPDNTSKNMDQVPVVRNMYNIGRYTGGVVPKSKSRRYDESGSVIEKGARGGGKKKAASKKKTASKKPAAKKKAVAKKKAATKKKAAVKKTARK